MDTAIFQQGSSVFLSVLVAYSMFSVRRHKLFSVYHFSLSFVSFCYSSISAFKEFIWQDTVLSCNVHRDYFLPSICPSFLPSFFPSLFYSSFFMPSFLPPFLPIPSSLSPQFLNNAKGFAVGLCLFALIQSYVTSGVVFTVTTTLEQRFGLPSVQTGFLASCYDIALVCVVLFVTYFGERGNKPLWLGYGALTFAGGSFLFALPQFTSGPYSPSVSI